MKERDIFTPRDATTWLDKSGIGATIEYHRGYIPSDRERFYRVEEVASIMLDAAERGVLHLFQDRRGEFDYRYIAMKRSLKGNR